MAGSVEYMTGAQLQSAIHAANQAVSGMTFAEAQAALSGSAQAAGAGQVSAFPLQYTEYGQVTIEAQYAAQLWEYWKTVAGAEGTTVLGAAAGSAISWAQGALIGTGTGTLAATAGLLTLSVPTAVAMAAPLMGVGLGAALYETNPELWTSISNGLVDYINEGTQTVTAFIDEAGHLLLDSAFVHKLQDIFEMESVPVFNPEEGGGTYTDPSIVEPIQGFANYFTGFDREWPDRTIASNASCSTMYGSISSPDIVFASATMFQWGSSSTNPNPPLTSNANYINYKGKPIYYFNTSLSRYNGAYGTPQTYHLSPSGSTASFLDLAYAMIYGEYTPEPTEYPEGTSKFEYADWKPEYDEYPDPVPIYDPQTQTTRPYYPVSPYVGDTPGTSVDPATTPQTKPTDPIPEWEPTIDPYIPPVVDPEVQWPDSEEIPVPDPDELVSPSAESDPIYVPEPDLDPDVDPATDPEPVPDPNTSDPDTDGEPPTPTGVSPPIIFPPPDIPFPTITPTGSDTPVPSGDPGFVQVYHPSTSELIAFGRWLWVTYADSTIDKIWNNPFDGVIGCHELYATPTDGGYSTIRCGFLDSGVSSQLVRVRYSSINCGSMIIPEYWGNYLDYSPYSKAYIYLPFIGIQELDVDDIVGSAVNVCYHIDAYNGSCIAQITCARDGYENTLYQFSGNCAVEYPLSGGSQAAIKAAMMTGDAYQAAANTAANATMWGGIGSGLASAVGGVAGGIATGLTGNIAGGISGGIGGIASGIGQAIGGYASSVGQRAYGQAQHTASMLSGKSIVQHSGNFGASYGAMGIKKPYIFIRRPIQKVVNNYNVLYGYPAHKQVIIGNCEGFLRCREVHVVSPLATDNEKAIIEQLLTTGVYVTDDFS